MKGAYYALRRGVKGRKTGVVHDVIPIRNLNVTISGAGAAVYFGTAVIAGLPAGNITFLSALMYLQGSSTDTDLTPTYNVTCAVGTTATADNNLASPTTDSDIIPALAAGAATARVTPIQRFPHTAANVGVQLDNTAGDLELNLNCTVPDADITNDQSAIITFNGNLHLTYVLAGDD